MGEKTNSKIKSDSSKTKPVYFNLDDEEELELYQKACNMNFSKWVKKQLRGNTKPIKTEEIKRDDEINKIENINEELDSMMI